MTATDELRRLLDERGMEYKDRDMFGKHVFHWGEPLHGAMFTDGGEWTELVIENASPEQAVEATLGRGACRKMPSSGDTVCIVRRHGYEMEFGYWRCSECGCECFEGARYCMGCGRKVVGA